MRRNKTAIRTDSETIRNWWRHLILLPVFLCLFGPFQSHAADGEGLVPVGKVDRLVNDARGQLGDADLSGLEKQQPVYLDHNLVTGPKSGTRLRFRDGAFFQLGPDGRASIDAFIFSPIDDQSVTHLDIVKGVFSIASGAKLAGHDLQVKTPVATIAIRGSLLRGFHWPGFGSMFYLPSGEADITTGSGDVALLKAGDMVVVPHDSQEPGQDIPPAMRAEIVKYVEGRLKPFRLNGKVPKRSAKSLQADGNHNLTLAARQQHETPSTGGAALISANAATEPDAINHARNKMPHLSEAIDNGYFNRNASSADRDAVDSTMHDAAHEKADNLMGKLTRHLQKTNDRIEAHAAKQVAAGIALASTSGRDIGVAAKSLAAGNPATARHAVAGALAIKGKTDRPDIAADVAAKAIEGAPARTFQIIEAAIKALPDENRLEGARAIANRVTDDNPAMLAEVNLWVNRLQPDAGLHVPEHQRERAGLAIDAAALGFVNEKVREPAPEPEQNKDTFRKSASGGGSAAAENRVALTTGDGGADGSFFDNINWPLILVIVLGLVFVAGTVMAIMRLVRARDRQKAS